MEIDFNKIKEFKKIKYALLNIVNSKKVDCPSPFTFSLFETPKKHKKTNQLEDLNKTLDKTIISITKTKKEIQSNFEYSNPSVLTLFIEFKEKTLSFEVWPQDNAYCIAKKTFNKLGMVASAQQLNKLSTLIQKQINSKINEIILKAKLEEKFEKKEKHSITIKFETPDLNNDNKNSLIYGNCLIGQLKIELPNNKVEIVKLTNQDDPRRVAIEFVEKFKLKNKMFSNILNALNDLKENWEKIFDLEEEKKVAKQFDNLIVAKTYFNFYYDHAKETHRIKISKGDDLQK